MFSICLGVISEGSALSIILFENFIRAGLAMDNSNKILQPIMVKMVRTFNVCGKTGLSKSFFANTSSVVVSI